MSFAPTDAISMSAELSRLNETFSFDCLEVQYQAKMNGMYSLKVLLCGDVSCYAFEEVVSHIQVTRWAKVTIESSRFEPLCFQGEVLRVEGASKFANGKELIWIECVPECYDLFVNKRSGIYLGASILETIDRGLTGRFNQFGYQHTTVSKSLRQNDSFYPTQNSMTQYNESDLAFILRNLTEYGVWSNLRQDYSGKGGVTFLVADHNDALNHMGSVDVLTKTNHEGSGIYNGEGSIGGGLPSQVRAIYFDESQNRYVIKTAGIEAYGGSGTGQLDHHCLGNLLTEKQVQHIADSTRDSLALTQYTLDANFQGLALQPGDVITIDSDGKEVPFVIQELSYAFAKGDPEEGDSTQYSQNHKLHGVCLVDAKGKALSYRAPIWVKESPKKAIGSEWVRAYPNYDYKGMMSGCYGLATGEIVIPDELGNIPVQFPYHYTEVCGNVPARYTRVISLSNQGGTTGRSFPVYKDTELQLTFANGNMDYPLIKGAAANEDTGHVHNSSIQQRTHYALPQGQYLTYSNVPGDNNFMTMGAIHAEGKDRSFMMLSNTQNPKIPGSKKLDHQMITNQSHEQVTLGDKTVLHAGNASTLNKQKKALPLTYIQFVIGDQTNIHRPDTTPALDDYLEGIGVDLDLTHKSGKIKSIQNLHTAKQGNLHVITQLLSQTTDPAVPVDYTEIKISLKHNKKNGTDETVTVNVISQNTKPIFPTNIITVQAQDWQKQKTTDDAGNIYYKVHLNVLAPAILFNFRQDAWKLEGENAKVYGALKPFFQEETYKGGHIRKTPLTDTELNFYEEMGKNVTVFIHGYNVGYGAWPVNFETEPLLEPVGDMTASLVPDRSTSLYRDDQAMLEAFPGITSSNLEMLTADQRYGSGAHKWLLCMEHNLNKAAGFDGKDYSKYTRLIGVAWQGNPSNPLDYSITMATPVFAAAKVFELIKQLHERGFKINLMAHSQGNDVLIRVLNQCGEAGIAVDHAFMWEAAIPNNSFDEDNQTRYMELRLPNRNTGELEKIPYEFKFPHATKGAKLVSVLYSNQDTILGGIPKGDDVINVMRQTFDDQGGGAMMAVSAGGVDAISNILNTEGINRPLHSVYYIASLFTYPLSYFTAGKLKWLESYYQLWLLTYGNGGLPHYQVGGGTPTRFAKTLEGQRANMAIAFPDLFQALKQATSIVDEVSEEMQNLYDQLSDAEKSAAMVLHALGLNSKVIPQAVAKADQGTARFSRAHAQYIQSMAAVILSGLTCVEAQPVQALGYSGILPSNPLFSDVKFQQSGQTKPGTAPTDPDHYLCVDHSAMLFPTKDFMKYIYKNTLMHPTITPEIGFKYFGEWSVG